MPNPEQPLLPMSLGLRDLGQRAGAHLLKVIREVIRDSGKQETIARALGVSETLLSQALNSQRVFHVEWLPTLLPFDHQHRILSYLAWESQCRVEPIQPFTPEDFRRAADEVLQDAGELGEVLHQRIVAKASGEKP